MNGYSYAADNPVNGTDPNGTMPGCGPDCAGTGIGGGGGGGCWGPGSEWLCGDTQGNTYDKTSSNNPTNNTTTNNGPITISQHVLAKTDNRTTQLLLAGWDYVVAQRGQPSTIQDEAGDWFQVCNVERAACIAAGIAGIFSTYASTPLYGEDGFTEAALLQGGILLTGASADDVNNHGAQQFMSLADPSTLDGASASDLGSVVEAACGGESFTADTEVVTASGKQVPISSLKQGDKVEAANTKTGKNEAQTVLAVLINHDTDLYDLILQTAVGPSIIHTTSDHLIWDETTHTWTEAAELHFGDLMLTADGTVARVVGGTTPKNPAGWMWDLTISSDHDFYVVVGDTPILVHNYNCIISDQQLTHIERNHTADGDLNDETKSTWTIGAEERGAAIDIVLEQDPEGVPNTNGRTGTIHRGVMPDNIGDGGYIGTGPARDGAYPIDEVEVIMNPDGTVRNAYPSAPELEGDF